MRGKRSNLIYDDPTFGRLFRWVATATALVSLYLAATHVHPKGVSFEVRFAVCWFGLSTVVLGPLVLLTKLPAIGRLVLGPELYRRRWITLQMIAWCEGVAHAAIGVALWMGDPHSLGIAEAIEMHSLPAVLELAGSHLGAMGFMPAVFFDSHPLGQAVKRFLGVETARSVPARCLLGSLALLGMSAAISYVIVTNFGK